MKLNLLCYTCGSVLIKDVPASEVDYIENKFFKIHSKCYPAQSKSLKTRKKSLRTQPAS
jgi:hypothetical protein